jgi:hypothetical protein
MSGSIIYTLICIYMLKSLYYFHYPLGGDEIILVKYLEDYSIY